MSSSTDAALKSSGRLSCIILSGGRGSRLGNQDKGLLEINGKKLIEYVLANISDDVSDIVISANRNIEQYHTYNPSVISDDNEIAYQGPLAGIASCLPYCEHELVLITSCDIPVLPSDLCTRLIAALESNDISICQVNQRLQPVFILRKKCLQSIQAALEDNQLALIKWVTAQLHIKVTFDATAPVFLNINTTDDMTDGVLTI